MFFLCGSLNIQNAESATPVTHEVFGYIITETVRITREPNIASSAVGPPLPYREKCTILARTERYVQVRASIKPAALGWIPDWLLVPNEPKAAKGFSDLVRLTIGADVILLDTCSSAGIGSGDTPTAVRVRKRLLTPTGQTSTSDIFGTFTVDFAKGTTSVYMYNNKQYVFEIAGDLKPTYNVAGKSFQPEHGSVYVVRRNGLERLAHINGFEFLRSNQSIPISSVKEIHSGIVGPVPQFFIVLEDNL